jgi:hypothetical protein
MKKAGVFAHDNFFSCWSYLCEKGRNGAPYITPP